MKIIVIKPFILDTRINILDRHPSSDILIRAANKIIFSHRIYYTMIDRYLSINENYNHVNAIIRVE